MMQPPRQIVAIAPRSRSQSLACDAARICAKPCAYATTLLAYSARRMSSIRSSRSAPWPGAGPASVVDAFFRSSRSADRPRANTASVIPVSGIPSPSASTAVQVPVPFCSA